MKFLNFVAFFLFLLPFEKGFSQDEGPHSRLPTVEFELTTNAADMIPPEMRARIGNPSEFQLQTKSSFVRHDLDLKLFLELIEKWLSKDKESFPNQRPNFRIVYMDPNSGGKTGELKEEQLPPLLREQLEVFRQRRGNDVTISSHLVTGDELKKALKKPANSSTAWSGVPLKEHIKKVKKRLEKEVLKKKEENSPLGKLKWFVDTGVNSVKKINTVGLLSIVSRAVFNGGVPAYVVTFTNPPPEMTDDELFSAWKTITLGMASFSSSVNIFLDLYTHFIFTDFEWQKTLQRWLAKKWGVTLRGRGRETDWREKIIYLISAKPKWSSFEGPFALLFSGLILHKLGGKGFAPGELGILESIASPFIHGGPLTILGNILALEASINVTMFSQFQPETLIAKRMREEMSSIAKSELEIQEGIFNILEQTEKNKINTFLVQNDEVKALEFFQDIRNLLEEGEIEIVEKKLKLLQDATEHAVSYEKIASKIYEAQAKEIHHSMEQLNEAQGKRIRVSNITGLKIAAISISSSISFLLVNAKHSPLATGIGVVGLASLATYGIIKTFNLTRPKVQRALFERYQTVKRSCSTLFGKRN